VALQDLLRDPDVCRVRIVCVPEKMIVEETKRNYMYLHLYGYQVDGAFINRILPEQTGSAFMNRWHEIQKKYLEELEHLFVEIPVTKIPWHSEEIRGGDAIDSLTDDITKQPGLFDRTIPDTQEVYEASEGGYCLSLTLPHVNSDEVAVTPHDCDIDIKINNYNRCIPLPGALRGMEVTDFTWDDHRLQIYFSGKDVRQS
jgi:arsenite-transporting ATPase